MHTYYLVVLLLVFWFQLIYGDQNAVHEKNYSDRLTEPNHQQSSLQQINHAYHATVSSDPNFFGIQATEPSIKSQTPHQVSNVNCLKPKFISVCCVFFFEAKICSTYCLI